MTDVFPRKKVQSLVSKPDVLDRDPAAGHGVGSMSIWQSALAVARERSNEALEMGFSNPALHTEFQ